MVTGGGGNVVSTNEFYPYGQGPQPTTQNHYLFSGKERDIESGLDYFGARYYAGSVGRFMSADWSAQAQPVPYAKLDEPQTLNLYAYVRNNPISLVDPDGHVDNPYFFDVAKWNTWAELEWRKSLDRMDEARERAKEEKKQAQQQSGQLSNDQIPYRFTIAGKTDIPAGNLGHGSANWWWYRLENSSGKTLKGKGYSVEEHILPLLDRGLQLPDATSEHTFVPVVKGFARDTVGLNFPPGTGSYMDQRVTQWFTVKFRGHTYDLTTEFEHRTSVVNGNVTTYVWDLVP